MIPEAAFALSGVAGTVTRILATPTPESKLTRQAAKKAIGEVILGGVLGILLPVFAPISADANLIVRAAMVFVISYAGGSALSDIIARAQGKVLTAGPK